MLKLRVLGFAAGAFGLALAWAGFPADASGVGIADYLLVGTGDQGVIGTATAVSNFELGANSSAVPMSGLAGSVPALPGNAQTVFVGTGGNGDTALTDPDGNFNLSNLDIFGDSGVDCAGPTSNCNDGVSNTNFNGNPLTTSNGINGNVDLSAVVNELTSAAATIPTFVGDHSLFLDFSDGQWDTNLTINLLAGVTVIDFDTHGNDLLLQNTNLLIDGQAGAFAIFRIPDEANFLVSGANLIVGNGGIGLNNVLFYTDKPDTNQHIKLQNSIVNGIAFWDLSTQGEVAFDNVQGCTQVVGAKINLNNVRLNNCAAVIPEPGSGWLVGVGLGFVGLLMRRRGH